MIGRFHKPGCPKLGTDRTASVPEIAHQPLPDESINDGEIRIWTARHLQEYAKSIIAARDAQWIARTGGGE